MVTLLMRATISTSTAATPSHGNKDFASARPYLRQFDFWVGDWDVYAAKSKQLVGHNRIEVLRKGHLLLENWQPVQGSTGKSMNFFDRQIGQWRQIWVASDGSVIDSSGTFSDGAMRLTGKQHYADGHTEEFRMSFTPQDNGDVIQLIEQSRDEGKTWYVWFHGRYVKRSSAVAFQPEKGRKSTKLPRRAFDFWAGDWNANVSPGQVVGHNRITLLLNGHLLLENWTSSGGSRGTSFNFYDPVLRKWRQHWVSDSGGLVWYLGNVASEAMEMKGYNLKPDGTQVMARVKWTPLANDRVHHSIEHSVDKGAIWTQYFNAKYVPRKP